MNHSTQTPFDALSNSDLIRQHCSRRIYCIRVAGQIDDGWTDWFDGLVITHEADETVFTGVVADQSALHGILRKIHDLGLELIELRRGEGAMMG